MKIGCTTVSIAPERKLRVDGWGMYSVEEIHAYLRDEPVFCHECQKSGVDHSVPCAYSDAMLQWLRETDSLWAIPPEMRKKVKQT